MSKRIFFVFGILAVIFSFNIHTTFAAPTLTADGGSGRSSTFVCGDHVNSEITGGAPNAQVDVTWQFEGRVQDWFNNFGRTDSSGRYSFTTPDPIDPGWSASSLINWIKFRVNGVETNQVFLPVNCTNIQLNKSTYRCGDNIVISMSEILGGQTGGVFWNNGQNTWPTGSTPGEPRWFGYMNGETFTATFPGGAGIVSTFNNYWPIRSNYWVQAADDTGARITPQAYFGVNCPITPTLGLVRSCSAGSGTANLSWGSIAGALSYELYRCEGQTCTPNTRIYNGSGLTYTDTNLTNGSYYRYKVLAKGMINGVLTSSADSQVQTYQVSCSGGGSQCAGGAANTCSSGQSGTFRCSASGREQCQQSGSDYCWVNNSCPAGQSCTGSGQCTSGTGPQCTPLTFRTITSSFSPASVAPSGSVTVRCDYGNATDSMGAYIQGGTSCTWIETTGTVARFTCVAPSSPGTYAVGCTMGNGTPSTINLCSYTNQLGYLTVTGGGGGSVPVVDIFANGGGGSITINSGDNVTLTWTATNNPTSCIASGSWAGAKSSSGTQSVGSITSSRSYTITCSNAAGSGSDTVTVNVDTPPEEPKCNNPYGVPDYYYECNSGQVNTYRCGGDSGREQCRFVNGSYCWYAAACSAGTYCSISNPSQCISPTYPIFIQGLKLLQDGNMPQASDPVYSQAITLSGGSFTTTSQTSNPFGFSSPSLVTGTNYTATAAVPSGWSVGYTICYGRVDCHVPGNMTMGNSVTINVPSNLPQGQRYADLHWYYIPPAATTGSIQISRVDSSSNPISGIDAWVDAITAASANPATFSPLSPGAHSAKVELPSNFIVDADTCEYNQGGTPCTVDFLNKPAISCDSTRCLVNVSVTAGKTMKVVFRYTGASIPPQCPNGGCSASCPVGQSVQVLPFGTDAYMKSRAVIAYSDPAETGGTGRIIVVGQGLDDKLYFKEWANNSVAIEWTQLNQLTTDQRPKFAHEGGALWLYAVDKTTDEIKKSQYTGGAPVFGVGRWKTFVGTGLYSNSMGTPGPNAVSNTPWGKFWTSGANADGTQTNPVKFKTCAASGTCGAIGQACGTGNCCSEGQCNTSTNICSPQCSDNIDNDGDGTTDCNDAACHTDGNASNTNSCTPTDDSESMGSITIRRVKNAVGGLFDATPTDAWVDAVSAVTTNPATFTLLDIGSHVAKVTDLLWFNEEARVCDTPTNTCANNSYWSTPIGAGVSTLTPSCDGIRCAVTTTLGNNLTNKILFRYSSCGSEGGTCCNTTDPNTQPQCKSGLICNGGTNTCVPGGGGGGSCGHSGEQCCSGTPNYCFAGEGNCSTSNVCTPQCSDGIDNDGSQGADANDPDCHTDGNPSNPGSYNPGDNNEGGTPQCSDGIDNDGDGKTDSQDPNCHTDGNANNPGSYNPNDNSEQDGGGDETFTLYHEGEAEACRTDSGFDQTGQEVVEGGQTKYYADLNLTDSYSERIKLNLGGTNRNVKVIVEAICLDTRTGGGDVPFSSATIPCIPGGPNDLIAQDADYPYNAKFLYYFGDGDLRISNARDEQLNWPGGDNLDFAVRSAPGPANGRYIVVVRVQSATNTDNFCRTQLVLAKGRGTPGFRER